MTYPSAVIGGHSYGGRVASLLAAQETPRALVLLSYPLHRPGHPEDLRVEHWPRIACPVLLLSGESDQFARIELLRESVELLPEREPDHLSRRAPRLDAACIDDALDRIAEFVARPRPDLAQRQASASMSWWPPFLSVPATSSSSVPASPPRGA